jgi:hypothetical protein
MCSSEEAYVPKRPYPGSLEAVYEGCACPQIDNHRGRGYGGDGYRWGWIVNEECPLHGVSEAEQKS